MDTPESAGPISPGATVTVAGANQRFGVIDLRSSLATLQTPGGEVIHVPAEYIQPATEEVNQNGQGS